MEGIDVLFVAAFGPIVRDDASRAFYADTLGIEFMDHQGYLFTDKVPGANTFALWPLSQVAESCFGTKEWPADRPVPDAWLEFEVQDIAAATAALKARGYDLLTEAKVEPWGQTVTRLISPEGMVVAVTHTPWAHKEAGS